MNKIDAGSIRIANIVRSQRPLSVLTGDSLDQHRRTTHQSSLPVHCGGSQPQSDFPGVREETWERILVSRDDLGGCVGTDQSHLRERRGRVVEGRRVSVYQSNGGVDCAKEEDSLVVACLGQPVAGLGREGREEWDA